MEPVANKMITRLCWLDLVLVAPMALPPVAYLIISIGIAADDAVGWVSPLHAMNDLGYLFMGVTGILAMVWSILRIKAPTRLSIALDCFARLGVAALLVYAWVLVGPSVIFVLFLATELVGAVLQAIVLRGSSNRQGQPA